MEPRKWYSAVSAAGDQQLPHEYPVCVCTVLLPTPENIAYLKKNGVVFYIDRPIEDIVKDVDPSGRPLLKDGPDKLYALDKERRDKYMSSCDYHIINDGSLEKVIDTILDIMKKYDKSPL